MQHTIRIDLTQVDCIVPAVSGVDRKMQLLQRKQSIAEYRNRLLSSYLHQDLDADSFAKTEHGKPYLNEYPNYYFNHSHSEKNYALASSHQVHDLGIDLEDLDRAVRFEALAKHAFHPNELAKWYASDQDKAYWFKVWTTKEAVLKASGLGIRLSLKTLDTQVHLLGSGGLCQHPLIGVFAYQNYSLAETMLTVAWRSERSCRGFAFPQIQLIQH